MWDKLTGEEKTRVLVSSSVGYLARKFGPGILREILESIVGNDLYWEVVSGVNGTSDEDVVREIGEKIFLSRPGQTEELEIIVIPKPSGCPDTTDAVFASRIIPCPHRPEFWAGGIACNRCEYFRGSEPLANGNVVRCAFIYCKENEK